MAENEVISKLLQARRLNFAAFYVSTAVGQKFVINCSTRNKTCVPLEYSLVCVHHKKGSDKNVDVYVVVSICDLQHFNCDQGGGGKIVPMKMCEEPSPTRTARLKRQINTDKDYPEDQKVKYNGFPVDNCPTNCEAANVIVCGRCSHDVFRTFMSACHLRMYQCKHPDEELEIVAWRSCLQSGPYRGDMQVPKDGEANQDGDPVLSYIYNRAESDNMKA